MESYATFTSDISKNEDDPITLAPIELKDDSHPRSILLIRRGNGKPYPIMVKSVLALLENGYDIDPVTRLPYSSTTRKKARMYDMAMRLFPEYTIANLKEKIPDLYSRWISSFSQPYDDEKKKLDFEAKSFLQPEDMIDLFKTFCKPN